MEKNEEFEVGSICCHQDDHKKEILIRLTRIYHRKGEMKARGTSVNTNGKLVSRVYKLSELKRIK